MSSDEAVQCPLNGIGSGLCNITDQTDSEVSKNAFANSLVSYVSCTRRAETSHAYLERKESPIRH